ncbi:hypothetical protein LTV02_15300 [Nocardia yamanashiensis]|uniref:hypothetical protein n=1 Tax=Nocardia yamanashiensis TaxID=209247 RepID=UPI001E59BFB6|nr:hypothetical protein [Nocardia yamanashiensis]UGT44671.1 hypothetical protein LTV02_15300 [Nocardia yamanashiensis]
MVWHFDADGKVDRVVNLSADQHQMDNCIWQNYTLAPLPDRLSDKVGGWGSPAVPPARRARGCGVSGSRTGGDSR